MENEFWDQREDKVVPHKEGMSARDELVRDMVAAPTVVSIPDF